MPIMAIGLFSGLAVPYRAAEFVGGGGWQLQIIKSYVFPVTLKDGIPDARHSRVYLPWFHPG